MTRHELTHADIMPMDKYVKVRTERRRAVTELKKNRRLVVGPDTTFYFECFETMWHQAHEMLYIEGGGDAQIADELAAYNPLIPKGNELVATLMFEIDDAKRRGRILAELGGVEETVTLHVDDETITAVPEDDVERTSSKGKASSIHFLHFPFTPGQVEKFCRSGAAVIVGIGHEKYGHMAAMPESVRQALAGDFD
ncbi:MAG TPA: DUF3501 family protein [Rhodospirillales bacterium]|jgi:hypothetical protein|nr:DUF3501 family protein [Rhodospirillales bacterium]